MSGCTTKEKLYEDNANRCLLLYTDMSKDQDRRISDYQTKLASGEINRDREQRYKELFQSMQRLLDPSPSSTRMQNTLPCPIRC